MKNNQSAVETANNQTRDALDLGVPMLPGKSKKTALPEDALSDEPTRGDYSGRLGESNYQPHEGRRDDEGASVIQSQSEFNVQTETGKPGEGKPGEVSEVETARARIAAIKSRMETDELTEDEFRQAKLDYQQATDDLEFAELRERAATERARKQRDAERRENLLSLQSDLSKLSDVSDLDKLLKKVGKSVDEFLTAAKAHQTKISEIGDAISAGGFQPGSVVGAIEDIPAIVERNLTKIGAVEIENFSIKSKLDQTIRDVTQTHFPRGLY